MQRKYYYFLAYAFAFICYGSMVTGIGPTILFFAEATGLAETHYSFIFFARAAGYIIGGTITKYITKLTSLHNLYIMVLFVAGASCIMSVLSLSDLNLGVWMLVSAASSCTLNILTNLCIFKVFYKDNEDFWIQLLHTMFGVGGLVGPLAARQLHYHSLTAIGIYFYVSMIPIWMLPSPESKEGVAVVDLRRDLPRMSELYICGLYLCYIASEVGLANWIPTYVVLLGVTDAEGASMLSTIFWVTNSVFRVVLLWMPGSVQKRLTILLLGLLISATVVNALQLVSYQVAAYLIVLTSGGFLSSMYALFLAISNEHGYKLNEANTANFMIACSLGEGVLIMPMGYAMGYFGSQALIFIINIIAAIMYVLYRLLLKTYEPAPLGQELLKIEKGV